MSAASPDRKLRSTIRNWRRQPVAPAPAGAYVPRRNMLIVDDNPENVGLEDRAKLLCIGMHGKRLAEGQRRTDDLLAGRIAQDDVDCRCPRSARARRQVGASPPKPLPEGSPTWKALGRGPERPRAAGRPSAPWRGPCGSFRPRPADCRSPIKRKHSVDPYAGFAGGGFRRRRLLIDQSTLTCVGKVHSRVGTGAQVVCTCAR